MPKLYPVVIIHHKSAKKNAAISAALTFATQFTHLSLTAAERNAQVELDALLLADSK